MIISAKYSIVAMEISSRIALKGFQVYVVGEYLLYYGPK